MMSTMAILNRAKQHLEILTPERLCVADDFLAYLEERESDEATAELLTLPGFLEKLHQAEGDVAVGSIIPVEKLHGKG